MRPWVRNTLEHVICLVAVAAGALAVLYPVLLEDRLPMPAGDTLFASPWEQARPTGLEAAGQPSPAAARQHYPWYVFLSDTVERGDSLLWNPLEGCGTPFFALWRSRCLSPFTLPFFFAPPETALPVSAFLKLLVAGACAFIAGRRLGFAPPLALFIGVSFQLSAPFFYWLDSPFSDTLPWLPLLVIFVDRLALGRIHYWPYGALVLALMLLGGEPEAVGGLFVITLVFIIARNLLGQRGYAQLFASISTYVIAIVAAVALCGIQIVPFYELAQACVTSGSLEPVVDLKLTHLAALFLPHLFGRTPYAFADSAWCAQTRIALLVHAGIIQLSLLPLWFAVRRYSPAPQRHRIEALLIASATGLVLAALVWMPLASVFPFSYLRPEHLLAAGALFMAIAAAAAAEEWLLLDADACKRTLKRLLAIVPASLAAAAIISALGWQSARAHDLHLLGQALIPAVFFVLTVVLVFVTMLKPSQRLMGYALSVLAVVQALAVFHPGSGYPAFPAREELFPRTPFIDALQENSYRAGGSLRLKEWPLTGNLVPQTYAPGGVVLERHQAFFGAAEHQPLLMRRAGSRNFVLTKEDTQGPFAPIRPLLRLKHVLPSGAGIFEDLEAKPRAWLTFEWRPVEAFDPAQLDSALPPLIEGPVPPPVEGGQNAAATVLPESGNTFLRIAVESGKPGVLYLADTWYPGWNARINGKPAAIFPIDGLFRGIHVPEGTSTVEMTYEPRSLVIGGWTSLCGGALTAGFILYLAIRWLVKRHRARKLERELQASPMP